jgi:hypothetical protein
VKCPVCAREVPRAFIRRGTFPCPTCKESLRLPRFSKPLGVAIMACTVSLAILILYLMGLKASAILIVTIILFPPLGAASGLVAGALQAYLFPSLERDSGFDDGGILHIVPPPGRSKGPQ